MSIHIGSIVVPKTEWLNPGEEKRPCVVVDVWDDPNVGQKMSVYDCAELVKYRNYPHFVSRFDTFTKYYDELEY